MPGGMAPLNGRKSWGVFSGLVKMPFPKMEKSLKTQTQAIKKYIISQ